jgi:hypothetical protein
MQFDGYSVSHGDSEFREIYRLWLQFPSAVEDRVLFWVGDEHYKPSDVFAYASQFNYRPKFISVQPWYPEVRAAMMEFLNERSYLNLEGESAEPMRQAIEERLNEVIAGLLIHGTYISRDPRRLSVRAFAEKTGDAVIISLFNVFNP